MRYYYAGVKNDTNSNLICNGVIDTFSEIEKKDHIRIEEYDESLIGKMWNGESWVENPNPQTPIIESDPVAELSAVIDVMLGIETEGATLEEMQETVDEMLGGSTE